MKHSQVIPSFFIVGVRDFAFTKELEVFLKEFHVSGLALFNSPFDNPLNIWADPQSALEIVYEFLSKVSKTDCFLAADQEGGRVRRLRAPFVHLPSAEKVSQSFETTGSLEFIKEIYAAAARQMAQSQITLNFAPVCDLRVKDSNSVIGDRSFGSSLKDVLPFIDLFCASFQAEGVHTCLKHFPGHGPTKFDSHEQAAVVFKSKKELFREDREVFIQATKHSSAIMTAHIAFEEDPERIFSLDLEYLEEFQRGFSKDTVWITDDLLGMKAVSSRKPWLRAFDCRYSFSLLCGNLEDSAIAVEETIRHSEALVQDFAQELEIEKRAKRANQIFKPTKDLPSFKIWKESILREESIGNDFLEKAKIHF